MKPKKDKKHEPMSTDMPFSAGVKQEQKGMGGVDYEAGNKMKSRHERRKKQGGN